MSHLLCCVSDIDMVHRVKKESYDLVEKQYKLVPPDGGWGYLVAIAAIINFSTTTAFGGCFGMMYNDFITEIQMSSASVTLLMGIFCMSSALAGFFTSALLKIMSIRMLAFAAAIVFSCGVFGTVIMTSAFLFFLSAGVCQGIGLGILYNLSCTIMNDYFLEKRVLVMSFVQTATGVNAMIAPIFVKWSIEQYGSKGTLLIIGALSLQNFLAVAVMQPVEWHMKKVVLTEKPELKLLLEEKSEVEKVTIPVVKLTEVEGNSEKAVLEKMLEFPEIYEKKSSVRKVLESLIDTSLLKTFLLTCAAFGTAMCATADGLYILILPQYLYSVGWSQDAVSMAIALYGLGDLAMRVIFTVVSKWMAKLGIEEIYIGGVAVAVISRISMLWSSSVTSKMMFFAMMGSAHCSIAVLTPVVISDAVAPEKFTSAIGIWLLLIGILSIGLGPAVGAVRDFTQSYSAAFYTLTSFYAIIVILWPIEMFIKKNKQRRKIVNASSKSSQNKVPQ